MADKDDDWHDRVSEMADELGLKGRERTKYVHEHMTAKGYRAVPQYVRDEEEDEDDGGSRFFGSRTRRSRDDEEDEDRTSRRRQPGTRRSRADDDWYG